MAGRYEFVRVDHVKGFVDDNPLTNAATTLNSTELSLLPTISGGSDWKLIPIVIDPLGQFNGPEWVYIDGYTNPNTSATILRGMRGTTAVEHPQGTPWVIPMGADDLARTVVKGATESVTSSVTLQDDDVLSLPIRADHRYRFDFDLFVDGAATGDILVDVGAPAGAGRWSARGPAQGNTTAEGSVRNEGTLTFNSAGLGFGVLASTAITLIEITGVYYPTANGDLKLRWAQRVSNATATRVLPDSNLTVVEF